MLVKPGDSADEQPVPAALLEFLGEAHSGKGLEQDLHSRFGQAPSAAALRSNLRVEPVRCQATTSLNLMKKEAFEMPVACGLQL